jgi:hypothetical protein
VRGVHLQGVQGRSRSSLLQALDNEVNERFVNARRVKNLEIEKKSFSTNYRLKNISKIVNNKLF